MNSTCPHLALITAHPGHVGGMEKFARFLVRCALDAGWKVTVGLSGQNIFQDDPGLTVDRMDWLDATFRGDREYRPRVILARRRWFRRVRPDVALFIQSSNSPFRASVVGAALARVPAVITHRTMPYVIPPVGSHRHGFGLLPGLGLYRRKMVAKTRWLAALATRIVYNSRQVGREYERDYRYPAGKGRVIPNAIELPAIVPESPRGQRPLTIGYVGRLAREKKLDVLLRAASGMGLQRPWRLAFWGDGAQRQPLTALAGELGITDRIAWHGNTNDAWSAYAQCDVVVLCSPRESSSNMILEAMAAGRAVIVTGVGGQPELVESGRCGLIVPPNEPAAITQALEQLMDDDARRIALGREARESARLWHDPRAIGRAWLELLTEAAGRGRDVVTAAGEGLWSNHFVPVDMPRL